MAKYYEVNIKSFGDVGKLKDRTVQLHINPDVKPIVQLA